MEASGPIPDVPLQHSGPEERSAAHDAPRDHEDAVAGIMERLGMPGPRSDVGLHDFEDEEVVFRDQRRVVQAAFEIAWHSRMSGASTSLPCATVRPNFSNLSTSAPEVLPMPTATSVSAVVGRLTTHSLLRRIMSWLWLALEIMRPINEGGEFEDSVPTQGHDVRSTAPFRRDQDDRTRLKIPPYAVDGKNRIS